MLHSFAVGANADCEDLIFLRLALWIRGLSFWTHCYDSLWFLGPSSHQDHRIKSLIHRHQYRNCSAIFPWTVVLAIDCGLLILRLEFLVPDDSREPALDLLSFFAFFSMLVASPRFDFWFSVVRAKLPKLRLAASSELAAGCTSFLAFELELEFLLMIPP